MDEDTVSQIEFDDDKTEKNDVRNVRKGILKEFIEMYKSHPALWRIKDKELYNNRNLKLRGYIELVKIWKKYDPQADQKTVKLKIQSLRGSFRKELKKVEKSQRSGTGVEDIYKSHLWYFDLLFFLTEHELPTSSIDNISVTEEVVVNNIENEINEGISEKSTPTNKRDMSERERGPGCKKSKKNNDDRERQTFLSKCAEALQSTPNESDALGQYISTKLEKVTNPEQRMYAESLLTKVLNMAIMGRLNQFTDISNTSHYSSADISYVSPAFSSEITTPPLPSPSLSSCTTPLFTQNTTNAEDPAVCSGLREYFVSMQP